MNVQLPLHMDKSAFLAWVQEREGRYELADGRVVMVVGGTLAHAILARRLIVLLDSKLDAEKWTLVADFGVDVGPDAVRYPDVVVAPSGGRAKDLTANAPVLIVEIISPSSAVLDLPEKALEYLQLPSLLAYIVLSQDEPKTWVWVRGDAGFPAGPAIVAGADKVIGIPALSVELPLSEIYRGV